MADTFWGVDAGGAKKDVTEATSTQSKKVELRVDTAITKKEILRAVDLIVSKIKQSTATPS